MNVDYQVATYCHACGSASNRFVGEHMIYPVPKSPEQPIAGNLSEPS